MTTHELQSLDLIDFHDHIAHLYEVVDMLKMRSIGEFETAKIYYRRKNKEMEEYFHLSEMSQKTAHRLERWARKQVLLKYATL